MARGLFCSLKVESSIAVSILIVAMNNIYPVVAGRLWGFALMGFNLGVEVGQLAIVGIFLPIGFPLRHRFIYQRFLRVAGSVAAIFLAVLWLVERMFNITLPSL